MGGFIEWLSGTHTCECGALYKIRTSRTPSPNTDSVNCDVCGKEMDKLAQFYFPSVLRACEPTGGPLRGETPMSKEI
jgi:hypothetical protein